MSIEKNTPTFLKHSGLVFTTTINYVMDLITDPLAYAIYHYLSAKPENWIVREKDLMNRFQVGRDSIRSRLSILRDLGLYTKEYVRNETGQFTGWHIVIHREPIFHNLEADNQLTENQASGKKSSKTHPDQVTEMPSTGLGDNRLNNPYINKRSPNKEREDNNTDECSSSSSDFVISPGADQSLLNARIKANQDDDRTDSEFLKQCKYHLDFKAGDYSEPQKLSGLLSIVKKGFHTPGGYVEHIQTEIHMNKNNDIRHYMFYCSSVKHDIQRTLLPENHKALSFDEWKCNGEPDKEIINLK